MRCPGRKTDAPVSRSLLVATDTRIGGLMVESHLVAGRQDLTPGKPLLYGQSITDACLGWDDSRAVLEILSEAVKASKDAARAVALAGSA